MSETFGNEITKKDLENKTHTSETSIMGGVTEKENKKETFLNQSLAKIMRLKDGLVKYIEEVDKESTLRRLRYSKASPMPKWMDIPTNTQQKLNKLLADPTVSQEDKELLTEALEERKIYDSRFNRTYEVIGAKWC